MYKVLLEKEYKKLSFDKPTIALAMMVKNEKKRLQFTLDSVVGTVDAMIIYDTGSTDNTIDIIKKHAERHEINLYLIQGEFEDFSASRNVYLDYAEKINVRYILLMDCNDELRGGSHLKEFAKFGLTVDSNCFLVCQEWYSGQYDKYYNSRFIKNRSGWRYKGSVHEWLKDTTQEGLESKYPVLRLPDEIILYQDRTQDDDKTGKRFPRDKVFLLKDLAKDPTDPRTIFYLAQTCQCLNEHEETLYYSKLRLNYEGFKEERFHSYLRCAKSALILGHGWHEAQKYYIQAYEEFCRVEPLCYIADYYRIKGTQEKEKGVLSYELWRNAYLYIKEACDLPYPSHCILFVDKGMYDYYRWYIMSIVASHLGKNEEGKQASLKALEAKVEVEANKHILQYYLDLEKKERESKTGPTGAKQTQVTLETKQQFVNRSIKELKVKHPDLNLEKLTKKANTLWKERSKTK
jgi:glycosyltransferase involved in cell wall biosynthesis